MRGNKYLLFQLMCAVLLQLMVIPSSGQEAESSGQEAESSGQEAESSEQEAESSEQEAESSGQEAESQDFTCKQLKNEKICFTASLCNEDNEYVSEIVGIELINCIMRRKFPIYKLNFDTDTLMKSVYRTSLINQDIDSLPDSIIRKVRDSQIKYLLIVYNFNSAREVSKKSKLKKPKYVHGTKDMSKSTDSGARPNRFASITCTVNLIDVLQNRSIYQKVLKADNTVCKNENIYCIVGKILKSICEDKGSGECKPCFKLK